MYSIISISGGGVRGLIPASELSVLSGEELDSIDCFAGTSTGGILALAAASGMGFSEIESMYQHFIPKIFKQRGFWDKVWRLDELRRANYNNDGLIKACKSVFGSLKMSELLTDVVVPCVCLNGRDPDSGVQTPRIVWFTRDMPDANKTFVWEVAVKTSSAPVYFPSYRGCVDGGLGVNNPASKAVLHAVEKGCTLKDINLLAITTGSSSLRASSKENDWGLIQWGPSIISLIMRLHEQESLDLLHTLGLGSYEVADFALTENVALDDKKWAKNFSVASYKSGKKAENAIKKFRENITKDR